MHGDREPAWTCIPARNRQHYRWRIGGCVAANITDPYFFAVNSLAGLRVEAPAPFPPCMP